MAAGRKWIGKDAEIFYKSDGTIKEMYSVGRTRRFRPPQMKKGKYPGCTANFERINEGEVYIPNVSNPYRNEDRYTNTHVEITDR